MDSPWTTGRSLSPKEPYCCGITPRRGTVLAGAFSMVATHLYLIFEQKHLAWGTCADTSLLSSSAGNMFSHFIVCWSLAVVLLLSLVTLGVSGFLLYSVYAQIYCGLPLYVCWVVCYEAANLAVQVLTNSSSPAPVRAMRWFGLAARTLLHCFWLYFVVSYARLSYKSQLQANILSYARHSSVLSRRVQWKP